ncbi:MAG: formate--tetrahydrofolate ligase [Acidobacteriota bacterium]
MKSDIEIARGTRLKEIELIRESLGIEDTEFWPYGHYKGKVSLRTVKRLEDKKDGKLIVVTAITPTRYGEGKTTTSIALSMGMNRLGKKSIVALREPSLGPVFGVKGGGAGGGYSQVLPMEDINLHFTGDIHAVTTAHNLLSAVVDNHIHFTNKKGLDTRKIVWTRAMDMNDRSLRNMVVGLGGKGQGYPREDGFIISAASEIMAILTLARNIEELKKRLGNILVGFTRDREPVYARDFKVCGAMAAVMRDAIKPNLVQTIENTPALIHGGPFANISFGTNSVTATKLALKLSDYVVTECGFGSDLGFEKYVDLVSASAGYKIHAVVVVATVRALRHQGGGEEIESLKDGVRNLGKHIGNIKDLGFEPVVAVNVFPDDKEEELKVIESYCRELGVEVERSEGFAKGGEGAIKLAEKVTTAADRSDGKFHRVYNSDDAPEIKIEKVAKRIYGADGVIFSWEAKRRLKVIKRLGMGNFPVCIAKTPLSFSDNSKKLNVPTGWRLNINKINIASGGGYLIPVSGDIMLMPGLPKVPSAEGIDIDISGHNITGLS